VPRILRDREDAEDAFQATFLTFARKSASIGQRGALAGWLYQVAYRTALRARARAARQPPAAELVEDLAVNAEQPGAEVWKDLRPLLDQEVSCLPEKYRVPVILCYLESKAYQEAADELGCTRGALSTRLARARDLLRHRLARRGVTLSAEMLALIPAERVSATAPAALVGVTVRAGLLFAAGQAAGGAVSMKVVTLAEGVVRAMRMSKQGVLLALALTLGMLGVGAGVLLLRAANAEGPALAADESARAGGRRLPIS
jgi:RNA polymerase sigma factor (sigma-70 family)